MTLLHSLLQTAAEGQQAIATVLLLLQLPLLLLNDLHHNSPHRNPLHALCLTGYQYVQLATSACMVPVGC